jgi:glycosyltransferase involved in cell wall biosynthesis
MSSDTFRQSSVRDYRVDDPNLARDARLVVLVLIDWYLPGAKGGGPVHSVSRIIEQLGEEFRWKVITRDRDLGDTIPYPSINDHDWHAVGRAHVRYLRSASGLSMRLRSAVRGTRYDVVYLNSFFSRLSVAFLFFRRLGFVARTPVMIAPRGEFSVRALGFNAYLKRLYIRLARVLRLCDDVVWAASTVYEARDIRREFATGNPEFRVQVVQDMVARLPAKAMPAPDKNRGAANLVFLSRIDRMKNLDGALQLLRGIRGKVTFDIYGPCNDEEYFAHCQTIAADLPENIVVRFLGAVPPDKVIDVLGQYDLFVLLSLGENFGHVVYEALASGCPILISDQTPWRGLQRTGGGWDFPGEETDRFEEAIQWVVDAGTNELGTMRTAARTLAAASVDQDRRMQEARDAITLVAYGPK